MVQDYCICLFVSATAYAWELEDNLWGSVLSFYQVSLRELAQVIRNGDTLLHHTLISMSVYQKHLVKERREWPLHSGLTAAKALSQHSRAVGRGS